MIIIEELKIKNQIVPSIHMPNSHGCHWKLCAHASEGRIWPSTPLSVHATLAAASKRRAGLNCLEPKPPAVFFLLYFSFLFHSDWNCNSSSGYSWCLCRQVLHSSASRRAVNCLQDVSLADQPVAVCTNKLHLDLVGSQRCHWDCLGARTWAPWPLVIHCNSVYDKLFHLFCAWAGTWWTWHVLNVILVKDAFLSQGF